MNKWFEIWNKDKKLCDEYSILQSLIYADGFDSAIGKVTEDSWMNYVNKISEKLNITVNDSIYDVGCGSGAFLYPFYQKGHKVGGIDYSKSLIDIAQSVMNDMAFTNNEAINIYTQLKYDYVLSNGVFFYFTDLNYAQQVLEKMLLKANKAVAIFDIPDLFKKEICECYRKRALPEGEYEKKYMGLDHLYFSKDWFVEIANKFGYQIEVFDQIMENYGNSKYRFNIIITKK